MLCRLLFSNGTHRNVLERLTRRLNIDDRVQFTGAVGYEERVRFLNQMWVVVQPSPKEGWGLTVIEANACGTPAVVANSPGLRDSVVDGQTGLLYSWGQINQLANQIVRILIDQGLRKKLQKGARAWAKQFSWDDSATKTLKIIDRVLNN
jgi:glycosyltransferase involved in cell wall biosynthesis